MTSLTSGLRPTSRAVAVTFDDGYRDNYRYALPILAHYRVPAAIYLVSSTLREHRVLWTSRLRQVLHRPTVSKLTLPGLYASTLPLDTEAARASAARTLTNTLNRMSAVARDGSIDQIAGLTGGSAPPAVDEWFLTLEQIREMSANGVTFGAHTVSHPNLPGIPPEDARMEISRSRAELEQVARNGGGALLVPEQRRHPRAFQRVHGSLRARGWISLGRDVSRTAPASLAAIRIGSVDSESIAPNHPSPDSTSCSRRRASGGMHNASRRPSSVVMTSIARSKRLLIVSSHFPPDRSAGTLSGSEVRE